MTKIELADGKYTVTHDNGNNLKALRYGEDWRDLVGDGLVLALVQRIEELEDYAGTQYERGYDDGYDQGCYENQ